MGQVVNNGTSVQPKEKHVAALVFNIIFIVLAVLIAVSGAFILTPARSIIEPLTQSSFLSSIINKVPNHILEPFGIGRTTLLGLSTTFFYLFVLWAVAAGLVVLLFFVYLPFLVMGHNKMVNKKGRTWRIVIEAIDALLNVFVIFSFICVCMPNNLAKIITFPNTVLTKGAALFENGGVLNALRIGNRNTYVMFTMYLFIALILVNAIVHVICMAGKCEEKAVVKENVQATTSTVTNNSKPAEAVAEPTPSATEFNPEPAAACAATPVVVENQINTEADIIAPTVHEILILNALEPIEAKPVAELPGIYETNADAIINELEPKEEKPVEEAKPVEETKPIEETKPFEEAKPVEETKPIEKAKPVEEAKPVVVEENKPVEKEKPVAVEEVKPVEQPKEEGPIFIAINDNLEDDKRPEETEQNVEKETSDTILEPGITANNTREDIITKPSTVKDEWILPEYVEEFKPVEEAKPAEEEKTNEEAKPVEEKENVTNIAAPEKDNAKIFEEAKPVEVAKPVEEEKPVEQPKEEGPVSIANNNNLEDGKRPEETEQVTSEDKNVTPVEVSTTTDNSHNDVKTEPSKIQDEWKLPKYVAPLPVKEEAKPAEVAKPVEQEKPVEPIKPVTPVEEEDEKRVFHLVDPMQHQNTVSQPSESENKLAPISGPLHGISKKRTQKIAPVAPTHVKFDLKQYQIKTYSGKLTPEEAFNKGVTKVQPTVNPVFINQKNEPAWKAKKINEEAKKNGYQDVKTLKISKPVKPIGASKSSAFGNAGSIRDMVKAKKKAK